MKRLLLTLPILTLSLAACTPAEQNAAIGGLGGRAGDGLGNLRELQRPLDAAAAQHDQAAGCGGSGDGSHDFHAKT